MQQLGQAQHVRTHATCATPWGGLAQQNSCNMCNSWGRLSTAELMQHLGVAQHKQLTTLAMLIRVSTTKANPKWRSNQKGAAKDTLQVDSLIRVRDQHGDVVIPLLADGMRNLIREGVPSALQDTLHTQPPQSMLHMLHGLHCTHT